MALRDISLNFRKYRNFDIYSIGSVVQPEAGAAFFGWSRSRSRSS